MTAVLLGQFTLGDAVPGLRDVLESTGQALQDLKGVVDAGIATLGLLENQINSLAQDLDSLKDDYLRGPIDELQSAVNAAQGLLNDVINQLASQYLSGILSKLDEAISLLRALSANDFLTDQIAAINSAIDGQQSKLNNLTSQLSTLTDIADDVAALTAPLGDLRNRLQTSANEAINGLIAYNEQLSQFLNSGVFVVRYNGPLSTLGSDVDAVLPNTGLDGFVEVAGPLLIVQTANTASLAALNAAFGL